MKRLNLEAKVGIFFVACFAIIAFISLRLGNYEFGEAAGYTLSARFPSAAGINDETPVLLAGLRIGQVTDMKLEAGEARIFFKVKEDAMVPNDSRIEIASRGFLGAKYLEIRPGQSAAAMKDGDQFQNVQTGGELADLSNAATAVMGDIKAITTNLRQVLGGEEGEEGMRDVFLNMQEITMRLGAMLAENQQRMALIVAHMEKLSANAAAITAENRQAMHEAIAALPAITENLAIISGNVAQLTDRNSDELDEAIRQMSLSAARLSETMDHLESITRKVDEGEGTVGKLINEPDTADSVNETLESVNDFVGKLRRLRTYVGYRGEYFIDGADIKSTIWLRLQPRMDKWYEVALIDDPFGRSVQTTRITRTTHDAGGPGEYKEKTIEEQTEIEDRLKFSAQIAKRWYDVVVRGGLIESHAGVGAEYLLFDDHLNLTVEVSDFADEDNPRLKAGMDFLFLDHFFIAGGADDLVHRDVLAGEADPRWYIGGGIYFNDEDIKSLFTSIPSSAF